MNRRNAEPGPRCDRCKRVSWPVIAVACTIAYRHGAVVQTGWLWRCQYCFPRADVPVGEQLSYLEER